MHKTSHGQHRMPLFQKVCSKQIQGTGNLPMLKQINQAPRCHYVHHFVPYLKLGPFHLEVKMYIPFRTIVHDFFTEHEMNWMMDFSRPALTSSRINQVSSPSNKTSESKDKVEVVSKAITNWFHDIQYNEEQTYKKISFDGMPLKYDITPLKDPYGYSIKLTTMYRISKKIELITSLNVTSRFGSSPYQATNYGLSGMVVTHIDPWGVESGVDIVEERVDLLRTGDFIATFMGYLENTEGGGGTCFPASDFEGLLEPMKGSAAFWINLVSSDEIDNRAAHGGCNVLKGQK